MGPGIRYHVATIVAIFLALGVGMIIGSSHLQEALVERLRVQLRDLNERFSNEIQPLRKDNEEKARAISILTRRVTLHALDGVRVAVVVTGDYGEAAQSAAGALRSAGATVAHTTVFPASFPMRLEVVLPGLLPTLRQRPSDSPGGTTAVFRALATLIARGVPSDELKKSTRGNLIEVNGDYRERVNAVVLVGGARDQAERRWLSVDYPLIEQLGEFGVTIVGAEPLDVVQSYMRAYQARGISTVDNVDTEIGRTCLVLLVKGDTGSYGVKGTARDGLLPSGAD